MRAGSEEAAFLEYKKNPSPDGLTALLTSVQDRVFNICYQILRRSEDAEDACQEILIELTRGLASLDAPRPFKVWLYRVAVHTALDRKAARDRQARLAQEASTSKPEGPPMNEAERAELMRAIRTLDDRTRCMVLEHYFDKLTLEEIGAREGVSAVAVFKRLDRARESLRRALLGAGFTVAAAGVAQSLEAVAPVVAPASMAAKSALIAGGVVMGTKSAISGGVIVMALLLIGAASTGGYLIGHARGAARKPQEESPRVVRTPAGIGNALIPPAQPENVVIRDDMPPPPVADPSAPGTPKPTPEKSKRPAVESLTVHFGRPEKYKSDDLRDVETWEEFYKLASEQKVRTAALEELIFQRASRDLGLDTKQTQALRELFESERVETTRTIVESCGGPEGFSKVMDDFGMNSKSIFEDWRRQRDLVRQAHNPEYLKHLSYEQLSFFNEHLRNSEINIETAYSPDHVHYLIAGVGKPAK